MKEMTLREVQLFGLEILKDVHTFCVSNHIEYSLAYGTLLGAVRHEGFIPWDDDIDIMMPRPDYERFCDTFQSGSGYNIFFPRKDSCYLGYARVCDLNKTWVHSMPWCNQSPTGMWIDIFPIDGIDSNCDRDKELEYLKALEKKRYIARIPKDNLMRPMPLYRRLRTIAKKLLFFWPSIRNVVREYENYIKSVDFNTSHYCGNKSILTYYKKEVFSRDFFNCYVDLKFEGFKFKAISSYDNYLKQIYGDYMQLPPVEKRVRHPQEMYWKDHETKTSSI